MARKLDIMKNIWLSTAYSLEDSFKFFTMGFAFGIGFHIARWMVNMWMVNMMSITSMGGPVG